MSAARQEPPRIEDLRALMASALDVPEQDITPGTSLSRDLGVDSLAVLRIVSLIERRYDVDVDENELDLIDTLDSAHRYLSTLVDERR